MPPPPRPLDGLVWPLVPNSKKAGDRSTTWANKQALAAAIGAVDPALAERVLAERQWRQKYTKYVYKHVEACLQSKAGLEWVHSNFEFVRGGKSMKLADAMSSIKGSFETGFLKGSKPKPTETVLEVCIWGVIDALPVVDAVETRAAACETGARSFDACTYSHVPCGTWGRGGGGQKASPGTARRSKRIFFAHQSLRYETRSLPSPRLFLFYYRCVLLASSAALDSGAVVLHPAS